MTTLICNKDAGGNHMVLSDEHPACSYHQPVLIHRGVAHGPSDYMDHGVFGFTPVHQETIETNGLLSEAEFGLITKWKDICKLAAQK